MKTSPKPSISTSPSKDLHFRAMRATGTGNQIRRAYRESDPMQWARETVINCFQSGAKRAHFTLEWQAIENNGVYRRLIVDDGCGMDEEQLVRFFSTWGASGQETRGEENNFGVGAKSSLLPWNAYGMVVVSRKNNEDSMIWLKHQTETGEYGLKLFQTEDENGIVQYSDVIKPFYDEEHGVNWKNVFPDWVGDHGTAVILLGNSPAEDTVLGDISRDAHSTYALTTYLNKRLCDIPSEFHVSVDRLPGNKTTWPRTKNTRGQSNSRTERVYGARAQIHDGGNASGSMKDHGTVLLGDGTRVDWFLWEGERQYRATKESMSGFIGIVYTSDNSLPEIYDHDANANRFRQFGIAESDVRKRLWLLITPVRSSSNRPGVFPNGARNSLLIQGSPHTRDGSSLPISEWGKEFCDKMPTPIITALDEARSKQSGTINDQEWRRRLMDKFGNMWRNSIVKQHSSGKLTSTPFLPGTPWKKPRIKSKKSPVLRIKPRPAKTNGNQKTPQLTIVGHKGLGSPGKSSSSSVDLPDFQWSTDQESFDPGMLAVWQPVSPSHPKGVVLLNRIHPIIGKVIQEACSKYPPHQEEIVKDAVTQAYGEVAVAKIAHSEYAKSLVPDAKIVDDTMRSQAALTMSLLGLISEDALVTRRLSARLTKKS
jgi:hypothetical protein